MEYLGPNTGVKPAPIVYGAAGSRACAKVSASPKATWTGSQTKGSAVTQHKVPTSASIRRALCEWIPSERGISSHHLALLIDEDDSTSFTVADESQQFQCAEKPQTLHTQKRRGSALAGEYSSPELSFKQGRTHQQKKQRLSSNLSSSRGKVQRPNSLSSTVRSDSVEDAMTELLRSSKKSNNEVELRALMESTKFNDLDMVVLPSISFDPESVASIAGVNHYEERNLWFLWYLTNPNFRLVFLSSQSISERIVQYQLSLLPFPEEKEQLSKNGSQVTRSKQMDVARSVDTGRNSAVGVSKVRQRLLMISAHNTSCIPLSQKLGTQPRLLQRVKNFLRPGQSVLRAFVTTPLETAVAQKLEIPYLGCNPTFAFFGTKQGSRQAFFHAGVPHCAGSYHDMHTPLEIAKGILSLAEKEKSNPHRHSALKQVVVKTNQGVSGLGNALYNLPDPETLSAHKSYAAKVALVTRQLLSDKYFHKAKGVTTETFFKQCLESGTIVEVFEKKKGLVSPSCQVLIDPSGEVEVISTHEQVLDGQVYKGCIFPANAAYRLKLQSEAIKVAKLLAHAGARNRMAIDFIAWPLKKHSDSKQKDSVVSSTRITRLTSCKREEEEEEEKEWEIAAIEINLRHGGTTAPAMTCKMLCTADLDKTGYYKSRKDGKAKSYIATDNFQNDCLKGLTPCDFLDLVESTPALQWNKKSQTGIVFHLIDCLCEHGKVGITAVGNSKEEANEIFSRCTSTLLRKTLHDHDKDVVLSVSSLFN